MPIDQRDLQLPQRREVINPAATDLSVEAAGVGQKLTGVRRKVGAGAREIGQKISNKADEISRRDFIKISVKVGKVLAVLGIIGFVYIERYGIASFIDDVASKFSVVEEKPLDPRIIEKFGADYPAWASERAQGRYGWYLNGSQDGELNITNIPKPGDKENSVWVLTYQYGATWPFVTPERDGDVLDQTLYPLPSEDSFVNRIADDLGLDDQQITDLRQRWKFLSVDPDAVVAWLEDLKKQGVKSVTDGMIKFYGDPVTFMTASSQ
jgi:hypothetical protein